MLSCYCFVFHNLSISVKRKQEAKHNFHVRIEQMNNKLKSLKVAQVKDDMDVDEDDGCDVVW